MDIQDFVPTGGGSLRDPVGTFAQTRYVHPDSHWAPLGGETDPGHAVSPAPSISPVQVYGATRQQRETRRGRPGTDTGNGYSHVATARMVRSALRPGV
jgi:hypothetical protein